MEYNTDQKARIDHWARGKYRGLNEARQIVLSAIEDSNDVDGADFRMLAFAQAEGRAVAHVVDVIDRRTAPTLPDALDRAADVLVQWATDEQHGASNEGQRFADSLRVQAYLAVARDARKWASGFRYEDAQVGA